MLIDCSRRQVSLKIFLESILAAGCPYFGIGKKWLRWCWLDCAHSRPERRTSRYNLAAYRMWEEPNIRWNYPSVVEAYKKERKGIESNMPKFCWSWTGGQETRAGHMIAYATRTVRHAPQLQVWQNALSWKAWKPPWDVKYRQIAREKWLER